MQTRKCMRTSNTQQSNRKDGAGTPGGGKVWGSVIKKDLVGGGVFNPEAQISVRNISPATEGGDQSILLKH